MLVSEFSNTTMPASDKTVYAWWQEENKPTDFTYTGTDTITISSYIGTSTTMWIPAYINDVPVTTIPASAFENKATLVKVVVPETVTSIGLGAFKGCIAIEDITLPFVGASADSNYYNAVFGYIFGYERVANEMKKVGYSTWSFDKCEGISKYYYEEPVYDYTNVKYSDIANAIWQYTCFDYYGVAGSSSTYKRYVMVSVYYYIPASIKSITITNQTEIPVAAFNNCYFIETINLPDTVESIGDYAFQNCGATINYFSKGE